MSRKRRGAGGFNTQLTHLRGLDERSGGQRPPMLSPQMSILDRIGGDLEPITTAVAAVSAVLVSLKVASFSQPNSAVSGVYDAEVLRGFDKAIESLPGDPSPEGSKDMAEAFDLLTKSDAPVHVLEHMRDKMMQHMGSKVAPDHEHMALPTVLQLLREALAKSGPATKEQMLREPGIVEVLEGFKGYVQWFGNTSHERLAVDLTLIAQATDIPASLREVLSAALIKRYNETRKTGENRAQYKQHIFEDEEEPTLPGAPHREQLEAWARLAPKLERNEVSRFHRLNEYVLINREGLPDARPHWHRMTEGIQPFLVEHDWAAGLGPHLGEVSDEEVKLPYEHTAFEFRVNARNVIVIVWQDDAPQNEFFTQCAIFVEVANGWTGIDYREHPVFEAVSDFLIAQIKAVCVALDAEVAYHEVMRCNYEKLNAKRARSGKPPLLEHHVVYLAHRHRAAPGPRREPGETGKVRLHFRRGHYRHFVSHKTWIKWQLVGNPDLGFISKNYQL